MKLISGSTDDLPEISAKIAEIGKSYSIWLFRGDLGAGKTTLIQSVCSYFKVEDNVSSPTFSLVNEYRTKNDETIYHFDFYRIEDETEAMDIGVEEYFDSGNLCLIEWPDKIPSLIPGRFLDIDITTLENETRSIILSKND